MLVLSMWMWAANNMRHIPTIYILWNYTRRTFEPTKYGAAPIGTVILHIAFWKSMTVMNQMNAIAYCLELCVKFQICKLIKREWCFVLEKYSKIVRSIGFVSASGQWNNINIRIIRLYCFLCQINSAIVALLYVLSSVCR